MIEEIIMHIKVVTLCVVFCDWIILIQVEGHNIFERNFLILIHSNELLIDS